MAADSFQGEGLVPSPWKEAMANWRFDVGDPQFWIDRRVACLLGDYPPCDAAYVSIQQYVKDLEATLQLRTQVLDTWSQAMARADNEIGRVKRERDELHALLTEVQIRCRLPVFDVEPSLSKRIKAALRRTA